MSPSSSGTRRARRGFSLVEATISLTLLVIVMVISMSLLFAMRSFAERQQFIMAPRQTARRAADYVSFHISGATDLNQSGLALSPNALVIYYNSSAANSATRVQASYNNLTGSETGNAITSAGVTSFGDVGTDIISVSIPNQPGKYPITSAKFPNDGANRTLYVAYNAGCPDNTDNLTAFKKATGESGGKSALLSVVDKDGEWIYTQITSYNASNCASAVARFIDVTINPGVAPASGGTLDPPGGHVPLTDPTYLVTGVQFVSFRVRNGNLQQKTGGPFDPVTDNPGTAFTTVMENVEDLQVAYMYLDGTIWNTAQQTIAADAGLCPGCSNVPWQGGPAAVTLPPLDVANVVGIRLTLTGRSPPLPIGSRQITNVSTSAAAQPLNLHFRPAAEDHTQTSPPPYDNFDHYRVTTTVILRNRILGS